MSRPKGFLDLPVELRNEICEYLIVKPTNTITMLENHNCFQNEISAAQPAISRVNKQIREETLPLFYKRNLFLAELTNFMDLLTAKSWLEAIGNVNAGCLRRIALRGWTKVDLGNGNKLRLWISCEMNLKDGRLEIDGNEVRLSDQPPHRLLSKDMGSMKEAFRAAVDAREGTPFDVKSLGLLMDGFHRLCTEDCTTERQDVDSSCRRCES